MAFAQISKCADESSLGEVLDTAVCRLRKTGTLHRVLPNKGALVFQHARQVHSASFSTAHHMDASSIFWPLRCMPLFSTTASYASLFQSIGSGCMATPTYYHLPEVLLPELSQLPMVHAYQQLVLVRMPALSQH